MANEYRPDDGSEEALNPRGVNRANEYRPDDGSEEALNPRALKVRLESLERGFYGNRGEQATHGSLRNRVHNLSERLDALDRYVRSQRPPTGRSFLQPQAAQNGAIRGSLTEAQIRALAPAKGEHE